MNKLRYIVRNTNAQSRRSFADDILNRRVPRLLKLEPAGLTVHVRKFLDLSSLETYLVNEVHVRTRR